MSNAAGAAAIAIAIAIALHRLAGEREFSSGDCKRYNTNAQIYMAHPIRDSYIFVHSVSVRTATVKVEARQPKIQIEAKPNQKANSSKSLTNIKISSIRNVSK